MGIWGHRGSWGQPCKVAKSWELGAGAACSQHARPGEEAFDERVRFCRRRVERSSAAPSLTTASPLCAALGYSGVTIARFPSTGASHSEVACLRSMATFMARAGRIAVSSADCIPLGLKGINSLVAAKNGSVRRRGSCCWRMRHRRTRCGNHLLPLGSDSSSRV